MKPEIVETAAKGKIIEKNVPLSQRKPTNYMMLSPS
jgi:hypothetical protein